MEKSTEGIWVNRIEAFWIHLDDCRKAIGETTKALFRKIANIVSGLLDQIFGKRMVSVQAFCSSINLSLASLCFLAAASTYQFAHMRQTPPPLIHYLSLMAAVGVVACLMGFACMSLVVLNAIRPSALWRPLSCLPVGMWLFGASALALQHMAGKAQFEIGVAMLISFTSDLVLLIAIRKSLRWLQEATNAFRMFLSIAAQFAVFLTVLLPLWLFLVKSSIVTGVETSRLVLLFGAFNLPTAVSSAAFGLSLIFLLLHRLIWPHLSTLTHNIFVRTDVLEKRKTLRLIGSFLIAIGMSS
jgi:hypothetical protein